MNIDEIVVEAANKVFYSNPPMSRTELIVEFASLAGKVERLYEKLIAEKNAEIERLKQRDSGPDFRNMPKSWGYH